MIRSGRVSRGARLGAALLALLGFLWVFIRHIASGAVEFAHDDIVFNYAPFREWYLSYLRAGTLPLWDPYAGIGRIAEIWTTLPVDLLTPVELFLPLSFGWLFSLQLGVALLLSFFALRALNLSPALALAATGMFWLSPATSYFLPYYIHNWPTLLYLVEFALLFLFLQQGQRRHLICIGLAALLLAPGGKLELLIYAFITLALSSLAYAILSACGGKKLARWWAALLMMLAGLLLHAWYFNIVQLAAEASLRDSRTGFAWRPFFDSFSFFWANKQDVWLLLTYFVMLLARVPVRGVRWPLLRNALYSACIIGTFSTAVFGQQESYNHFILGIALGFAIHLLDRGVTIKNALRSVVLLLPFFCYFLRSSPGELNEIDILYSQIGEPYQALFAALLAVGLLAGPLRGLRLWAFLAVGVVLLMRGVGTIFLSHLTGVMWLPARDSFLIELPLALLAAMGIQRLLAWLRLAGRHWAGKRLRPEAWVRLLSIFLPLLVVIYAYQNLQRSSVLVASPSAEPFSKRLRAEAASFAPRLERQGAAPARILSYFHGFGRLAGYGDVREYGSLLSRRYAQYSIAGRLGLKIEDTENAGVRTGGISERYLRLGRPVNFLEKSVNREFDDGNYYYYYLVQAVPPLSCSQLRLLGVQYVEHYRGRYWQLNSRYINGLYAEGKISGQSGLAPDVRAKIDSCGFPETLLGTRSYWQVIGAMPAAYFLESAEKDLTNISPLGIEPFGSELALADGRRLPWKPVLVEAYGPNEVRVAINVDRPGWVVLSDLYHPRWDVEVDGGVASLRPAFFLFRAVEVQAGQHFVRFHLPYPRRLPAILFTLLGLVAASIAWLIARNRL